MSRNKKSESEEVEELLRAAEDDVFLKLSLNSHMARGSSTQFIDPDLDQRFQVLRSKQTPPKKTISKQGLDNQPPSDDLLTRFAALKSSLPAYSSSSSSAKQQAEAEAVVEDDDDEVEKVIKWAIDAARLDPSPDGDDDDDDDDDSTIDEDDGENSDDDRKATRK
ncbi:uncharacterized protein LOC129884810 [Solanum dulcamara]|uniref:uncharacterized protein LOC129884810 n=1 Tax=Solanum dulcamara TaxID=45834 RepID=UPI0024864C1C|nr:uncharacterized protein LOC129884810 [Solanum dulcamara]